MFRGTCTGRVVAILGLAIVIFGRSTLAASGLSDSTILLIRHAEKPGEGDGLSPAGEARAQAYIQYFKNFRFRPASGKLDAIYASADSRKSYRPRSTVEPLARALGLVVDVTFKDKDYPGLIKALRERPAALNILVCWHHGGLPEMLSALGANPATLLPGGAWPDDEYDWVLELEYDHEGQLHRARRIVEGLTGSRPPPG